MYNWRKVLLQGKKRKLSLNDDDSEASGYENNTSTGEQAQGNAVTNNSDFADTIISLQEQINALQKKVATSERRISQMEAPMLHERITPLQRRLAVHLNQFLRKKPTIFSSHSASDASSSGLYKQCVFSATVDCTLSQFDSLAWDVKYKSDSGRFEPSYDEFRRLPRRVGKISFKNFEEIGSFFGIFTQDAKDLIVSTREKKGYTEVMNVIGTMAVKEEDEKHPLIICAGGDVSQWTESDMYAVRRTMEWNDGDSTFIENLLLCDKELYRTVFDSVVIDAHVKKEFSIEWRSVDWVEANYANTYSRRDDVMGSVVLHIPYIIVRSAFACEEILPLWTSFVKQ